MGSEIVGDYRWSGGTAAVDEFPDDFAVGFYLEEPTFVVFGYVGVAVGEAFLGAHGLAEKLDVGIAIGLVYPGNFLSDGIEFNDECLAGVGTVAGEEAVVE